jgi:YggT family protein
VAVPPGSLLVLTLAEVIRVVLDFFFFTILAQAILSWVAAASQSYDNPAFEILGTINEPILAPVRSLIPPISGIDLSPLFALIALQVLKRLLLPPLLGLA